MKERPIPFSAPMVRAVRADLKTQTRRVAKAVRHPDFGNLYEPGALAREKQHVIERACPYGQPGDRLWVREAWSTHACFDDIAPRDLTTNSICYRADGFIKTGKYRPPMFMPRRYSRELLEVTGVRLQRLTDISTEDCIAEGIDRSPSMAFPGSHVWCDYRLPHDPAEWFSSPVCSFKSLWESINGVGSWSAKPWVWVVEFRRLPAAQFQCAA